MTRAGWLALAVGLMMLAAGVMKTINLLILLAHLLFVLILLNLWLAPRALRYVRLQTHAAPLLHAMQPGRIVYCIRNDGDTATDVQCIEASAVHHIAAFVPALRPHSTRDLILAWPPRPRGVYAVEPVRIASGYPFGFVQCSRIVAEGTERVVAPALGRVDLARFRRWLIRTGAGDGRSRRPVARQSPHMADVRGVRAYRSGDNPRHIHWRSTARRNELLVRDYDGSEPLDLVIVVEPYLPRTATEQDRQMLEAALSLAASILQAWCQGDGSPRVTLVAHSMESGRATAGMLPALFGDLSRVAGSYAVPALPAELKRHCTPRSVRLLISSRDGEGELPIVLRQSGGAFVRITPATVWPWYTPPG